MKNTSSVPTESGSRHHRLARLDEIRGLTLISMMLYHFLWDLVYIAGFRLPWYHGTGAYIWQQSICRTFIFLSGFCWSLGKKHFKRGLTVFLSGGLVTVVTLLFLPEDKVVFGVLSLLGSAMLLLIPLHGLFSHMKTTWENALGLMACVLLFHLTFSVSSGAALIPDAWYANYFTAYLGFPMAGFYSTDYFALIPWFFLFLAGYFSYRLLFVCGNAENVIRRNLRRFLESQTVPCANRIGRHSLLLYLLHQPVLYGITLLIIR